MIKFGQRYVTPSSTPTPPPPPHSIFHNSLHPQGDNFSNRDNQGLELEVQKEVLCEQRKGVGDT